MQAQQPNQKEERDFAVHDFIPFASHYSPDTILTKNGELIQFIKLDFDAGSTDDQFRENLRNAINEHIDPSKYAVWLHTTRTREEYKKLNVEDYIKTVEINWRRNLPSKVHYDNCIYISILRDSKKFNPFMPMNYIRALLHSAERKYQIKLLEEHAAELTETVAKLHAPLKQYGATKLQVYTEDGVHYSEPMEFLHRILSFHDDHVPLTIADLSRFLIPEDISFNTYSGEIMVRSKRGMHYGAVISLKECDRLPARSLDNLLNIDAEIVISQSLDLASGNTQLGPLEYQKYIDTLNEDEDFGKLSGVADIDEMKPEMFALQQTNIILMQDTREGLRAKLIEIHDELSRLGIVCIVEDLRVERSFWSILPGNFSFLRRQDIVAKKDIANFAILGNDLYQQCENSLFGDPVTFFESQDGEPYPFHFINNGSGHILAVGEDERQRTSLLHLFALHTKKFNPNIIYYDGFGNHKNFANQIGARYEDKLDFEKWKSISEEKTTILIMNSLDKIMGSSGGEDFFNSFLDHMGENNSIVIASTKVEDRCIRILPNFDSQIYFSTQNLKPLTENYDLFFDETKVINLLGKRNIYLKHNYEELVVRFTEDQSLIKALIKGSFD